MKRTKNMYINPSHEANELELFCLHNDRYIYRCLQGVVANLKKYYKRGNYNPDRAIDAFYPVMTEAAKRYIREFCSIGARPFSVTDRFTAAAAMVEHFEEDITEN